MYDLKCDVRSGAVTALIVVDLRNQDMCTACKGTL